MKQNANTLHQTNLTGTRKICTGKKASITGVLRWIATVTALAWPGGGDNISITRISMKTGKKDGDFYNPA